MSDSYFEPEAEEVELPPEPGGEGHDDAYGYDVDEELAAHVALMRADLDDEPEPEPDEPWPDAALYDASGLPPANAAWEAAYFAS